MTRLRQFAARLGAVLWRRRREREFDEEIAHHLAALEAAARTAGASAAAARAAALRQFGGVAQTREAWRDQRGFARLEAFWLDLRVAARTLARRPLLVAAASLSIAVGVGLNLGVYAAVTRVLFQTTLSGAIGDRLAAINGEISYPNYLDLAHVDAFSGVAAMQVTSLPWQSNGGVVLVGAKVVSANFFDVVGVRAAYGRTFHDGELAAAVLGYGFWQRRYGGDPSVVGRTMTVAGWPYVIAGILPREFNAPVAPMVASDIYVAIGPQVCELLESRATAQFDLVGRLRDGVTPGQARAAVAAAVADLERRYPRENERLGRHVSVDAAAGVGLWRALAGGALPLVFVAATTLYALVGLVLLIACANVAGLLLARAEERRKEIAVCAALGASRARLAQRFVAESLIIAALGAVLAALLFRAAAAAITQVAWTTGALTLTLPPLPIVYCALLVAAVALACAVGPAVSIGRIAPAPALNAAGWSSSPGRARGRRALVVAQVAICFVLLSGASLLFHDVVRMRAIDPGFDTAHTLSVELRIPPPQKQVRPRPFERLRAAIRRLPNVVSVSAARNLPLMFMARRAEVRADRVDAGFFQTDIMPIGPGFLQTLGIPLLRGRDLADRDFRYQGWSSSTPVVVNETLARQLTGGADPIGTPLVLGAERGSGGSRALEIVGVARDARLRSLDETPHPVVYLPEIGDFFFVRVAGDAASAVHMVEQTVGGIEPAAWVQARPLAAQVAFARRPAQIGSSALAVLGAIGLAMAMVGLYAVVNYTVNRRTFEIGVRLALGATRAEVLRLVVREGLALVAIGCAIGAGAALALVRLVSSVITLNQGHVDPLALGGATIVTAAVGALACLAPALRAARIDPAVALRAE